MLEKATIGINGDLSLSKFLLLIPDDREFKFFAKNTQC